MEDKNNQMSDALSKYINNKNELFSKEALNKMRSPEKLDSILPITDPISWLGLIAIGILVLSIIYWSIYGSFTIKVDGMGLITASKTVVNEAIVKEESNLGYDVQNCSKKHIGTTKDLSGVLYVSVEKGKRIKPGMTILLAPNSVDTSKDGCLLGKVCAVSEYPVSTQEIQNRLRIDSLSQWIISSQQTALMEVSFDLIKDSASKSGYLWTSSGGEHPLVTDGSFCKGSIIIERRPPFEKVFYKLSQWLRTW